MIKPPVSKWDRLYKEVRDKNPGVNFFELQKLIIEKLEGNHASLMRARTAARNRSAVENSSDVELRNNVIRRMVAAGYRHNDAESATDSPTKLLEAAAKVGLL